MIRFVRGAEPAELSRERRKRLARAVLARRSGKTFAVEGYNLPRARKDLYEAQHAKCAYCERPIGKAGPPIEHFRPTGGADRGDPFARTHSVAQDRYWWLAWTWNNLLLSCTTCNSPAFKGNWFPLEPGSPELLIPDGVLHDGHVCFTVGIERGLLIDPAWDDPLDHMTWRPLDPALPDGPWRAFHRTERGRFTIHTLGLDGRNVDRADDHIRHRVKPYTDRVKAALASAKNAQARAIWEEAIMHLFAPAQPFHAVAHDALDFLVPAGVRTHAGLVLPRPGASLAAPLSVQTTPAAPGPASPEKGAGLPEDVMLHVLADESTTPELITRICQARPSTLEQLAELLEVSTQTIQKHCLDLTRSGTLVLDASQRYTSIASRPPSTTP